MGNSIGSSGKEWKPIASLAKCWKRIGSPGKDVKQDRLPKQMLENIGSPIKGFEKDRIPRHGGEQKDRILRQGCGKI